MRNFSCRYSKYVLGLFVFIFALVLIQWVAEAKITDEAIVIDEEIAVFDKDNPHMKKVMDVQNRHTHGLMATPEVVGTATGLTDDNKPAVLVFTKKAVEAGVIPENLEGIPVAVKVTGEIFALKDPLGSKGKGTVDPTARFSSPVPIGVSTGNIGECSAGTIGARVKSGNSVYALSNNHVYALENHASIGSKVLQPGLYDTQCVINSNNVIGTLSDFVTINFNGGTNRVDAAIASVNTGSFSRSLGNSTPSNGYGTPSSKIATAYIGQAVQKYGRTTGLTKGTVNGINATFTVCYNSSCSLTATFIEQIVVGPGSFSKAGDSGSLVVTNDTNARPVGLLFAGGGGITILNPIDAVLSSFGVTIDGTSR